MTYQDALTALFPGGPPTDFREWAIVFPSAVQSGLAAAMSGVPGQCRVQAKPLTDGRWMLCADVLSEIAPGRLYARLFAIVPAQAWQASSIITMAEARALLPVASDEQT